MSKLRRKSQKYNIGRHGQVKRGHRYDAKTIREKSLFYRDDYRMNDQDFRRKLPRFYRRRKPIQNDDQRHFNPDSSPLKTDGVYANIRTRRQRGWKSNNFSTGFEFEQPKRVRTCKKRSSRRAAIFASGKAGKGKALKGPKKYTRDSLISCKG